MTKKLPKRGLPPMHPGELLREEILPALARPKTEIAKLLGVSRQTLYDILAEKQPVTPVMALRLGKLCGNGPGSLAQFAKALRSATGPARARGKDQNHSDIGNGVNAEPGTLAAFRRKLCLAFHSNISPFSQTGRASTSAVRHSDSAKRESRASTAARTAKSATEAIRLREPQRPYQSFLLIA